MARARTKTLADRPRPSINGRPLTAAQQLDWRRANDHLASGDLARVKRGVELLRQLEAALRAAETEASVRAGIDDTIRLERGRGETVQVSTRSDAGGRIRIRSRDVLETLQRSGAINDVQFRAGMIYRGLYEAADPERDLRSQMRDLDGSGLAARPLARLRLGRSGACDWQARWRPSRTRCAWRTAAAKACVRCAKSRATPVASATLRRRRRSGAIGARWASRWPSPPNTSA